MNNKAEYTPEKVVDISNLSREDWLEYRKKGIGGSDVAAIMGISPFATIRDLFYNKTGVQPVIQEEEESNWVAKEVGHRLEDLVAEIFSKKTGLEVFPVRVMFRHPLYPFMLADVDFFVRMPDGTFAILECKTCNYNAKDKWADEGIPAHYVLQVRHCTLGTSYVQNKYQIQRSEIIMIKKLRVAVDHGNRNMKTCHFIFTTGLTEQDKKPARGEKYLKYQGKYYTLSEKRIPYQRDKTQDSRNRFWILTLFAIAMELEQKSQIQPEDVIQVELPIGLPPKHFAELCERYERYFKGDGKVQELCFNDKVYHLCIQNVMAFPQDYAAMMTRMMEIREIPKVVGIDIGGFTSDYLLMRSGRPDMDYCDSLEKGVITMYNDIISSINSEYDMLLEEADIDSIIKGKTQYYEEAVVQAVETMVQNFVTDLLNSIRERGIDTKSTYTVFIGGGAVLLERFLEQADRLGKHTFIRDMKANADGYDLLYRMTQAGV